MAAASLLLLSLAQTSDDLVRQPGDGADALRDEVATAHERGRPVAVTTEFCSANEERLTIVATSGDEVGARRLSSAIVWIDDVVAIPALSFSSRVGEVRVRWRLAAGDHAVTVEVRGSPGDLLRVNLRWQGRPWPIGCHVCRSRRVTRGDLPPRSVSFSPATPTPRRTPRSGSRGGRATSRPTASPTRSSASRTR